MRLDFYGTNGVVQFTTRNLPREEEHNKHTCDNIVKYGLHAAEVEAHSEFHKFQRCAVASKLPEPWRGHYQDDGPYSFRWGRSSPLEHANTLSLLLKVGMQERGDPSRRITQCDARLIDPGIAFFGSNGSVDYAMLTPGRERLRRLGFSLNCKETNLAGSNMFEALKILHSMDVIHSNVSPDCIEFDPLQGIFVLTDLFCMSTPNTLVQESSGINPLYSWQEPVLHRVEAGKDHFKMIRRVGDCVAMIMVLTYMASLNPCRLVGVDVWERLKAPLKGDGTRGVVAHSSITRCAVAESFLSGESTLREACSAPW